MTPQPEKKTPHILIVDDDKAHQELCLRAFRDDPELVRVSVAGSVREAARIIETDPVDLIVADWLLPDGRGLEVLPRSNGLVTVPLIIMTSHGDEHLAVEIMKSGAIDYVVKSATMFRELPHTARRAIRDWENIRIRREAEEAAREAQKRVADIIAFLPDAVFAIDITGRVIAWNRAMEEMTGVPGTEMLGKGDHEYSIPFYGERRPILIDLSFLADVDIEQKYDYVKREGDRITSETFIAALHGGNGAYLWGTATRLYDLQGTVTGAIEIIRDITGRKQAELMVETQKNTLETLLNAPHDTIALLDRQGFIIGINTEGARRLGGSVAEIAGRCAYDLLPHDLAAARRDAIGRVFATGTPAVIDDERSGMSLHNEVYPIFNPDHTAVDRVAIFARDVSEQKRAEQALVESENRFRRISGLISDFAYSCTRSGDVPFTIDWISGDILRVTGYTEGEIVASGCWRCLVAEEDLPLFDASIGSLSPGTSSRCELRIRQKDGAQRWLRCFAECIHDISDAGRHRLFGGCIDITDQRVAEQALVESEERYRSLVENLNEGIWVIDQDGVTTFANPQMAHMLGYTVEEMTGRPLFAFMDDDGRSVAVSLMERRRQGVTERHDFELVKEDGSRIITVVNTTPLFDKHGIFTGALAGVTDITRQRVVEKTLVASETRFRELFDNMGAGVAVYAVSGNGNDFVIHDINRAVERIEHVRREDVIGRSVREVFPGVEEFGLLNVFRRVARSGIAESHPVMQYTDERIAGWRENYVYKLPSGEIVAIYEDLTEKKQAEESAAEAREWLGMALRAAKAGTWDWDMATGTLTWSPEFYELFGMVPGSPATFESWLAALHPDDRKPAMARIDQSVKEHTYLWNEYRVILPDGTLRWIGAGGTTVYSPEGKPVRMSGICLDISDLKQAEERLRVQGQILDQMHEGICMVRASDNTIVYTNPRFNIMFGYEAGELEGRDISVINAPDADRTPNQVAEEILMNLKEHGIWSGEVLNIKKDGIPVPCHASVTTFDHPQFGQVWIAVHEDITERKQAEEALQQSEVRYRTLTETVPDIIARFDRDHRHIFINAAIGKITGNPPEFYLGKTNRDLGMPEDLVAHWDTKLEGVFVHGQPDTLEFVYSSAGKDRFFESLLVPEFSPEGQVVSVVSIARDVTDRRNSEAALEKSRIQLDDAMDLANIVYWELDVLLGLFTFNDRFYSLYATTAEREGGYTMSAQEYAKRFIPAEEQELVAQETQKAIETANPDYVAQIEHRIIRRDGKVRTIVVRYSVVKDAAGRTVKTYGANQDITDRKVMEQALHDSEERLRLALEGADIASWDWDLKTGKAIFSDRFYTILEYRPGDFPATYESLIGLMHPDDRQKILPMIQEQIEEKRPFIEAEYRLLSRDGAWLWFLSRGRIVDYDENGTPSHLTGVSIDITNRRLMESEIRSLNTVLEQRVKDRTEALSQANNALEVENAQRLEAETKLRASIEEKSMLLKEIHHRVKNNLQIIASLLNLQSRYIRDEQTLAAIRESQNRVKAMALVHEKLYRAEDISHISLEDYVKFLGNGLFQFYDAKSRGIRFQLDIQAVSVDINTAIPLGLIINELISNSLKYAFPEGRKGTVSVTVRQEGMDLTVLYADDGIGIPAELDWKNTQSLGLRLVNTLVDQMDGTVELDRTGGTRFTMLLHSKA